MLKSLFLVAALCASAAGVAAEPVVVLDDSATTSDPFVNGDQNAEDQNWDCTYCQNTPKPAPKPRKPEYQ